MTLNPFRFITNLLTTRISIAPELLRTGGPPPKPVICWEPGFRRDGFDGWRPAPTKHNPFDLSYYQDQEAGRPAPPSPPKHDPFDLSYYSDR